MPDAAICSIFSNFFFHTVGLETWSNLFSRTDVLKLKYQASRAGIMRKGL